MKLSYRASLLGNDTVVSLVEAGRRTDRGDTLVQGLVVSFCSDRGFGGGDQVRNNVNKHFPPYISATYICSVVLNEMGSDTKDRIWSSVTLTITMEMTGFFISQYFHSSVMSHFGVQVWVYYVRNSCFITLMW